MIPDKTQEQIDLKSWVEPLDNSLTAPDTLGREKFARSLSDAIANLPSDRSVVTAVYGPWGSGKSWLLNQIVRSLKSDHPATITVCEFSPWELNSSGQILEEFFKAVASNIRKEEGLEELSRNFASYAQFIIAASYGAGAVTTAWQLGSGIGAPHYIGLAVQALLISIGKMWSEAFRTKGKPPAKTLFEIKEEISQQLLEKLSAPILVVIDDLDRLTDTEIRLMIKLINTNANLPKLHYLIFGDRLQIARALDPVCGGQGDRYLEKMVQNTFQVPEPGENQIRLRVWSGMEKLARNHGEDIADHSKRFSHFWDCFLKHRIQNYRDCHRLLRTLNFHAGALSQDSVIEVDLMDLLGVDFLRVFDPKVYQKIAAETPTHIWCFANLNKISGSEKDEDSARALEFLKETQLDQKTVCGAMVSLFPDLGGHIKNHLKKHQLDMLRYQTSSNKVSSRGVRHFDKSEIYFQLNLSASDLPEAKVREFLSASQDELRMHKLLESYRPRGWLPQLLSRLASDPDSIKDANHAIRILSAISYISDDLDDNELGGMSSLTDSLIGLVSNGGLQNEIVSIIQGTHDVTLGLSILENLRDASDCTFTQGSTAPPGMPTLSRDEIEDLSDVILPRVIDRFRRDAFMKSHREAYRAYRMAYALGPERTERVLKDALETMSASPKIWNLVEAIAISIMPSIRLDSWDEPGLKTTKDSALLDHLLQFASIKFWKDFIGDEALFLTELSEQLVEHLKLPICEKWNNYSEEDSS